MDADRFPAPPREKPPPPPPPLNPRGPPPDVPPPPRPSPPILERFRVMLRDREEELVRDAEDEDAPRPLSSEDVVPLYEEVLSELTFNSKPIITELTIIAGEQQEHAAGIADAICSRILDVPVDQKLPCLYLLDSIVKNIGSEYVRYFSVRLPEVFCDAYNQVPSNIRASMRHLFGTWSPVFSSSVRRKIQNELQFSSPESQQSSGSGNIRNSESPSPRPAHGIHVNPKYLEARHQFDRSVDSWERDPRIRPNASDFGGDLVERKPPDMPKKWSGGSSNYHDIQRPNETLSGLDRYEHKPLLQVRDYDLDQPDAVGQSGVLGDSLPIAMGCGSALADSNSSRYRHPSPKAFLGRLSERNSWQEKTSIDSDTKQIEPQYDIANELSAIRSRELIDAYGNSKGKSVLPMKPLKIQRLEGNGTNPEASVRNWQTSEEEEYVWEDMSPTLADRSKSSRSMLNDNFRNSVSAAYLKKPLASISDVDLRRSNWSLHMQSSLDVPSTASDEEFGTRLTHRGPRTSMVHQQISHFTHEPWKSRYVPQQSSQLSLNPRSQGRISQPSLSTADASAVSHRRLLCAPFESDAQFEMPSGTHCESTSNNKLPPKSSSAATDKLLAQGPTSAHIVPSTTWPSVQKSHPLSTMFVPSQPRQFTDRLNSAEASRPMMNQGIDMPFSSSWQPSDTFDRRMSSSGMSLPTSYQSLNSVSVNLNNQSNVPLQFPHQDPQGSIIVSKATAPYLTPHLPTQGLATFPSSSYPNLLSLQPPPFLAPRVPESSLHMPSGSLPPLPPGPPPAVHQFGSSGSTMGSVTSSTLPSGFSGLINSLVSQGLISLAPQTTSQDTIGVKFNPDHLKVRHESAINDLYVNLPRQCTTCGMRFKSKEEHSNHMDWHVTKNRMAKNRKQKSSRKWFVTSKEWLSGAETVGVDAVPGFLPMDAIVDKSEEKELAVPADENQNLCALCGEQFEDFYSDEADEWMYKGAVYLNAPVGYIGGMDKSQLGPIVHAKCRSESNEVQGQA